MRKVLLSLLLLTLTICTPSSRAQSTTYKPTCLDSATTASVQTIFSTVGSAFGLAGGTTTDISNEVLIKMDAGCQNQATVAGQITALQQNISAVNTQLAAQQAVINNLQAAVAALSATGGGTPPPNNPPPNNPPPTTLPTSGNVVVNPGGANQAACQNGTAVVPAGTLGTIVAGPKTFAGTPCLNISFTPATFNGWTPQASLSSH